MTIGIYCIQHVASGKRYIGKSVNVEARLAAHKWSLTRPLAIKSVNRHLRNAVQRDGWSAFRTIILESFKELDEALLAQAELHWMSHLNTVDRKYGYNLRLESLIGPVVHEETRALLRSRYTGSKNPNFGNKWSDEQRAQMSQVAKGRHASGLHYGEAWLETQRANTVARWLDAAYAEHIATTLKVVKRKYDFFQYTRAGKFVDCYCSVDRIIEANPGFKWQNVYSACSGHKKTYMNFVWRKKPKILDCDL